MIRIGSIKKMWKGWRVLLFAYVSNNSPLKSQYFVWETCKDKKEYVKVGKGVLHNEQRNYPVLKLYVPKWSICRYMFGGESVVVFGIGKWDEEYWPPKKYKQFMIHEEICTYEVAKLAKEKGFDEPTLYAYDEESRRLARMRYCVKRNSRTKGLITLAAPTQSLLQRWLRDNGFGEVEVRHWSETNKYPHHYGWEVKDNLGDRMSYSSKMFDTYELALEDALKYALENIV